MMARDRQDHPEAFQEKKRRPITDEYCREYSGMIALVMRLSGGKIKDARQASYALLGIAIAIAAISLLIFIAQGSGSVRPPPEEFVYPPGVTP